MSVNEDEDTTTYKVAVNHEEQYSIWPADRENARGWSDVGKSGSKAECMAHINELWTDMRPLSVRKKMTENGLRSAPLDQPLSHPRWTDQNRQFMDRSKPAISGGRDQ